MLVIYLPFLLGSFGIFILDSCKKNQFDKSDSGMASRQFIDALNANKKQISSIALNSQGSNLSAATTNTTENTVGELLYLDFPEGTDPLTIGQFSNNLSIQSVTDALSNYRAAIQDTANSDTDISFVVPVEQITTSLQPLVVEARNYLISKGFTAQTIQEMIQEEEVTELELIPFVKSLTIIEQNQYTVRNFSLPFINSATAMPKVLQCGMTALGADALFALSASGASSWTPGAMKTAFKAVAKRFMGPIGVAIAVISFGMCMLG